VTPPALAITVAEAVGRQRAAAVGVAPRQLAAVEQLGGEGKLGRVDLLDEAVPLVGSMSS